MVDANTVSPSHKLPCTPLERDRLGCLNAGKCFAIPSYNGYRETACECAREWEGNRCEQRWIDPAILAVQQRNVRTAHMAAGVSVCILVFFVVLLSVYVYIKKRKRQRSTGAVSSNQTRPTVNNNNNAIPNGTKSEKSENGDTVFHNNECTSPTTSLLSNNNKKAPDKSSGTPNQNGEATSLTPVKIRLNSENIPYIDNVDPKDLVV